MIPHANHFTLVPSFPYMIYFCHRDSAKQKHYLNIVVIKILLNDSKITLQDHQAEIYSN